MKKTFAYALLVLTALYSCEEGKQEEPVLPETTPDEIYLNVSPHTLTFDETDASKNIITVSTNTNWKATVDNSELKINRTEGTSEDTSISITEAPEGKTCKLTISTIPANGEKTISKEVSISRAAAVVTPDRTIIYNNDFDKETAVKNTYWPYLDQFDGWKNANGTGSGAETYDQMSVSVRSDWTSDYAPPSDYRPYASGKNNIYFNKAGSFVSINNINIAQEKDFILQFGSSENKTFDYDDLKVEIGNGASWVEIDYSRNPTNSWALTTSMFSLQNSSGTLSIRLTATGTTQMRIDDIRLTDGEPSEQIIVFDNRWQNCLHTKTMTTSSLTTARSAVTGYGTILCCSIKRNTPLCGLPTRSIHVIGETAEEPRLGRQTLSSKCYIRPKFMEKHSAIIKTIHAGIKYLRPTVRQPTN